MMQQNQEMLGFRQQQTYYDSYPAESEQRTVKESRCLQVQTTTQERH